MARSNGDFNFPSNLEVKKAAPLDSRQRVDTYSELFESSTWEDADGYTFIFKGLCTSVVNDTAELNGLYILTDTTGSISDYTWEKVGTTMNWLELPIEQ